MNTRHLNRVGALATITATLGLLSFGLAAPASATDGGTPVTFNVQAGYLTISVPTTTAALSSVTSSYAAQSATGLLGVVSVTDARGGSLPWSATVYSSAFGAIAASNVNYAALTPSTLTTIGPVNDVVTANDLTDISSGKSAVTASTVFGSNFASWNPTIRVTVPANTPVTTYSGTITHSFA